MRPTLPATLTCVFFLAACGEPADSSAPDGMASTSPAAADLKLVSCETLADHDFMNTTISLAETVAAGEFSVPTLAFGGMGPDYAAMPEFCRIVGALHPTDDSEIRFELWLPTQHWNGRFMQTGNGGVAGSIVHSSMVDPLMRGYAVTNTDTGHVSGGTDIWGWTVDHPEKLRDYAWRAVHELTITGKEITTTHYGNEPEKSYFVGCSTGGRQGLMEAQRFPDDYDGIIAGAPAANWSPLMALSIVIQVNLGEEKLPVSKLGLLKEAAIASCDALDGVEDRVITNIAQCDFDPAQLQCLGSESAQCLTPEEVNAAHTIYAGVVSSDGTVWFPGTGPASEPLWAPYASPAFSLGTGYFRDILLEDPNWDPASFDADSLMSMAVENSAELIAMDPDISHFINHGGKLITYHGTTDGLISYGNTMNYVEAVQNTLGDSVMNDALRFYLVPGMDHCSGGEGAHAIDWLSALEEWVENEQAPGTLAGLHPALPAGMPGTDNAMGEFTRPICAWPEVPEYNGSGDIMMAASFSCRAP